MNLLARINRFVLTYLEVFKSFKRFSLWMPFLVYALLQIVVLSLLVCFASPPLSTVLVPIFKKAYGEAVLHYPLFFIFLPTIFSTTSVIIGLVFGVVLDGAAVYMFCSHFSGKRVSFASGFRSALSKYWMLLLLGVLKLPVIWIMKIPFWLLKDVAAGSPKREFALGIGCIALGVIYTGVFVYATPEVIWRNRKIFEAIGSAWKIFSRSFVSTFLFIFVPLMINLPVNFLKGQSRVLIARFNPEVIAWIVVLGVALSILINYLSLGTISRFYLEEEPAE